MSGVGFRPRGRMRVCVLLLSFLSGCATRIPPTGEPGCPVVPVASQSLGDAANLRAQIEIRSHGKRVGFDIVARANQDQLIVVGLAPTGARQFAVRQIDRDFQVEPTPSPMLRYVALWVMDALHRSHWIEPAIAVQGDTVRDSKWAGETLRESRSGDRRRREFIRTHPAPAVVGVTINYSPPSAADRSGRIEIQNEWCGYDASIVILDEEGPAKQDTKSREGSG